MFRSLTKSLKARLSHSNSLEEEEEEEVFESQEIPPECMPTDNKFTIRRLKRFNGIELPICMAICGEVVNVSSSLNIQAGEGGYGALWAGNDATYSLATMSLEPKDANKRNYTLEDFTLEQRKTLAGWYKHFTTTYPVIGTVVEYEDWDFSIIHKLAENEKPFAGMQTSKKSPFATKNPFKAPIKVISREPEATSSSAIQNPPKAAIAKQVIATESEEIANAKSPSATKNPSKAAIAKQVFTKVSGDIANAKSPSATNESEDIANAECPSAIKILPRAAIAKKLTRADSEDIANDFGREPRKKTRPCCDDVADVAHPLFGSTISMHSVQSRDIVEVFIEEQSLGRSTKEMGIDVKQIKLYQSGSVLTDAAKVEKIVCQGEVFSL